ncbi:MAG: TIGR00730 family Rossman fold protein [Anaerolineales bacterium]|nr:TIGR00730 family Rossman fold protein [Anaerolineales bacterium]
MLSVCVYCGSSDISDEIYLQAAQQTGEVIAKAGLRLIYGGGSTGLMGAVADAVLDAGGTVTGVITKQFDTPELAHQGLTEMVVLPDMHTRKARMVALADGFMALPGGFGTLDELFEVLTWAQIGLHTKPVGLLNVDGYFDNLLAFLDDVRARGFIYAEHKDLYMSADSPQALLAALKAYEPPTDLARWVDRTST